MSGVITLTGMMLPLVGMVQSRLHNKVRQAPINIEPGSITLCLLVRNVIREICGTANPKNEIGPQKAVVVAVSRPVQTNRQLRILCTLMPRLVA